MDRLVFLNETFHFNQTDLFGLGQTDKNSVTHFTPAQSMKL